MLTLTLFRHAKSSWDAPQLRDIDRPLNQRGKSQARKMGEWLSERQIDPDLLICSTARRARQTLKQLRKNWDCKADTVFESRLYLASPGVIIGLLDEFGKKIPHIMVIGHNPGLHILATRLAQKGESQALQRLAEKYPTSAVSVIESKAGKWKKIARAPGNLLYFATPKSLADDRATIS